MSNYASKTQTRANAAKAATLANWDGHFAIENATTARTTITALCCGDRAACQRPLNAENYNGYAATARRSCSLPCAYNNNSSSASSSDDEDGANATRQRIALHKTLLQQQTGSTAVRSSMDAGVDYSGTAQRYQHGHSRLALLTRQALLGSSLIGDSMTEIVIDDLHNAEDEPTSAILSYCKKQFLQPYVVILSLVGINPITTDTTACRACMNYLQVLIVLSILCAGYVLQYFCAYRIDRGFAQQLASEAEAETLSEHARFVRTLGELIFAYIIPSTLHLVGYLAAVIVCKMYDREQLLNLIERVFLMSMKPRRLCCILWSYLSCACLVLLLWAFYITHSVCVQSQLLDNKHMKYKLPEWEVLSKVLLVITLLMQQLVQIVIICSYCIECYLLRVHLLTLSYKLRLHSINYLDWMREMLEFHKLLERLNDRVASPVCFFIVLNLSAAFAGFVYLFKDFNFHYSEASVILANVGNIVLLLLLGLLPFLMAATLTRTCQRAQANGHQIRVRPFVYHNSTVDELNSTLLFASSLDMSAKLFCMPIQSNYLCFAIVFISMSIIILGMCFNLTALSGF